MADEKCEICDTTIKTMAFKGTGVCSDNCRKRRIGEDPAISSHPATMKTELPLEFTNESGGVDPRGIN